MKNPIIGLLCALYFWVGLASAKDAAPLAEDPVVEQRLIAISEELRCLVCQNESLAGSRADLAMDLRREVRGLIKQGKSDAEIKSFLVERYGDFILYRPPLKPSTWLLWVGPFGLALLGVGMLLRYLRRRNRDIESEHGLTDEERKRAQALLQEGER